ncbi:MAG TPA: hypothetical protein VJT31_24425, partial [Rugosimonospora sp.]|nr:hypothetical protein [Rugosimonospora sp.]
MGKGVNTMGAPEIALVGAGTGGDREPLVAELARRLSALGYLPTVIDLLSVVPAPVAATVRLRYAMTARRAPQAGPAPSRLGV